MNVELKAKWVAALRSGSYEQGIGRLYNPTDDTHCCLGVLCRVAGIPEEDFASKMFLGQVHGSYTLVSQDTFQSHRIHGEAIALNDSARLSFSEIADWIEKEVPVEEYPVGSWDIYPQVHEAA